MALRVNATTRLGLPQRSYLSLPGIDQALQKLLAAYAVLSANSATILAQPDLSLSFLATLPQDQALLREHVTFMRDSDTLTGGIMAAFQAVGSIAKSVQNMADGLQAVAQSLDAAQVLTAARPADSANAENLADLLQTLRGGLDALLVQTTALDPDSQSTALILGRAQQALSGFVQGALTDDLTRFEDAQKQASGLDGIEKLSLQIDSLQEQLGDINREIASGATSQILQSLLYVFAVALAIGEAITEPGLLIISVGFVIKEEVDEGSGFAADMKSKNAQANALIDQYRSLVENLVRDEQEMAVLLTLGGHCRAYRDSVADATQALQNLLGQVQLLAHGIEALSLVDTGFAPGFFSQQLSSAAIAWKAVAENCGNYLQLACSLH